jgi:DnaJ domain
MDPFAVLGLDPDATAEQAAEAYRRLAKEWHPDLNSGPDAARAMAQINAAYELVCSAGWQRRAHSIRARRRVRRGAWLDESVRRARGGELLGALRDGERVAIVTPVSTWASPRTLLAVTDRRLLWLLDDAVLNRVRAVEFAAVSGLEPRASWPRRRTATLRLRLLDGRRVSFSGLRRPTADTIAAHVRAAHPSRPARRRPDSDERRADACAGA